MQDSSKIEAKVTKTSDSMAWECKLFTREFLGFQYTEDMDMNCRVLYNICMSQHIQTHIISLIQIWYKITSRLKPKSMKTSDTRA